MHYAFTQIMNTRLLTLILVLFAEAIIAIIFFYLIPIQILPTDIRWLDFIVLTVINIIFVLNILFPLVRLDDKSHQEVAGLGIQWTATGWYAALAFLFMVGNIIYAWQSLSPALSFGIQAIIQSILLLCFCGGIVASRASMQKAQEVYESESREKKGKADIKAALSDLLAKAENTPKLPAEITDRIRRISADTRYITPSGSAEAKKADKTIINDCDIIEVALSDYDMNREIITLNLSRLENDLKSRRSLQNP